MFSLTDYDYKLPPELIAQHPVPQRDSSRLLSLERKTGKLSHCLFSDICNFLMPGDVLVVNNTEVMPGRISGNKETGGKVEALLLDCAARLKQKQKKNRLICACLLKASKPPKNGSLLSFEQGLIAQVISFKNGIYTLKFSYQGDFEKLLYRIGKMPLPPYITRGTETKEPCNDKIAYQTVYASQKGAVAAPTAGLHFSEELLKKIESKGVQIVEITLHVGYGTFMPVRVSDIRDHKIHSEEYVISAEQARIINQAKAGQSKIVAVGTTCVRTLEFAFNNKGILNSGTGKCDLFIYPGYKFKGVDCMITNFHLPKSTLLMLVSAFAGREKILKAYREAIREQYRFYSYGDAMFIYS